MEMVCCGLVGWANNQPSTYKVNFIVAGLIRIDETLLNYLL